MRIAAIFKLFEYKRGSFDIVKYHSLTATAAYPLFFSDKSLT